ncbi:Asp-tRNA(Asn)/Glu-tRNA(Gln) amidotransferase A subunit family amidase [Duganella sp. 1224]|uniref:amidase n=1 Tax=Duganella sp. 1224 TaxID=2587052 RepID=UPI0015CB59D6|nr:amidase [Duganella sp. 1224]NYE59949.1 Asp-tRNA(Asn)/Glu-tRNA(Gln) amidotransferase A subunit family amidase [Duganella sp. 1224]
MHDFKRNLLEPDATALLADLRRGVLTSAQIVESHLARIERTQAQMNGATHIFRDQAMALARQMDQAGDRSLPLFGLPCSVKETFGLAGQQVTAGSLRMAPETHAEDAEIVRRLKAAGAIVIARSNVPEFAMTAESSNPRFGRTSNPLDLRRVAGGSSGGEGALVGSGGSVFGVGSDILGSIRIPAAFCGVVGFKPHAGAVNPRGTWPTVSGNTRSWLALGPLTRSVRDAELVYNVIAERPVAAASAPGRLIAPRNFPLTMRAPCIELALAAATGALLGEGYREEAHDFADTRQLYLQIPKLILDDFYTDWLRLLSNERHGRYSPFTELLAQLIGKPTVDAGLLRWTLIGPLLRPRSAAKVWEMAARFADARTRYHAMLGTDGVIVLPTLGLLAPRHGQMNKLSLKPGINGLFTAHTMGNYLDLPAIAIPAWKFRDPISGLPPSISVLCAPGAEGQLFKAARRIEAVLN